MTAKDIYDNLKTTYTNAYFKSMYELERDLSNDMTLPCVVVVPVLKKPEYKYGAFKNVETIVIASLKKASLEEFITEEAYDEVKTLENELLSNLTFAMSDGQVILSLSELLKFDEAVYWAAFSIDVTENIPCP